MEKKMTDVKFYAMVIGIVLVITIGCFGSVYLVENPELRNISYYKNETKTGEK